MTNNKEKWLDKHPFGYYNNERDKGTGAEKIQSTRQVFEDWEDDIDDDIDWDAYEASLDIGDDMSDEEADDHHANLYGGDRTYCRYCGTKLVMDEWGGTCPKCNPNTDLYEDTVGLESAWKLVDRKTVTDDDGFLTEYSWYTNGEVHRFIFGDSDIYDAEDEADWECDTEAEAREWFDNYEGIESDDEYEDDIMESLDEDDEWDGFKEDFDVNCSISESKEDEYVDKPFTKSQIRDELKLETRNWTVEKDEARYGFEEEYLYAIKVLEKHYENVEGDDYRMSIKFDTPKRKGRKTFNESAEERDGGYALFALDKSTGKEYCDGVFETSEDAHYWATMGHMADREYGYGDFSYRVEWVDEYTKELYDSTSELNRIRIANSEGHSIEESVEDKHLKESEISDWDSTDSLGDDMADERVGYLVVVFEEKDKMGKFTKVFDNVDEAKEFADNEYPNAYHITIRKEEARGRMSAPLCTRREGKWECRGLNENKSLSYKGYEIYSPTDEDDCEVYIKKDGKDLTDDSGKRLQFNWNKDAKEYVDSLNESKEDDRSSTMELPSHLLDADSKEIEDKIIKYGTEFFEGDGFITGVNADTSYGTIEIYFNADVPNGDIDDFIYWAGDKLYSETLNENKEDDLYDYKTRQATGSWDHDDTDYLLNQNEDDYIYTAYDRYDNPMESFRTEKDAMDYVDAQEDFDRVAKVTKQEGKREIVIYREDDGESEQYDESIKSPDAVNNALKKFRSVNDDYGCDKCGMRVPQDKTHWFYGASVGLCDGCYSKLSKEEEEKLDADGKLEECDNKCDVQEGLLGDIWHTFTRKERVVFEGNSEGKQLALDWIKENIKPEMQKKGYEPIVTNGYYSVYYNKKDLAKEPTYKVTDIWGLRTARDLMKRFGKSNSDNGSSSPKRGSNGDALAITTDGRIVGADKYRLRESKQLNEGPGAGYKLSGKMSITKVESLTPVKFEKAEYGSYDVTFDCVALGKIEDFEFYSYSYGDKMDEAEVEISAIKTNFYAENIENIEELVKNNLDEVRDCLVGATVHVDYMYGGGWSHSKFDGTIAEINNLVKDSDIVYGDTFDIEVFELDAKIRDTDVIDYIDKAVTGDNIVTEYTVFDSDDEPVDTFFDKSDAINFAKENHYARVDSEEFIEKANGDQDFGHRETVWENDEEDFE